jgi:hypothetical protein
MGCAARKHLETELVASVPSKQIPPSFELENTATGFLQFKEPGPCKTKMNTSLIVSDVNNLNMVDWNHS